LGFPKQNFKKVAEESYSDVSASCGGKNPNLRNYQVGRASHKLDEKPISSLKFWHMPHGHCGRSAHKVSHVEGDARTNCW